MESVDISPRKSFDNLHKQINKNVGDSFNSTNIMVFLVVLVVFAVLFSSLGNSGSAPQAGSNILEIILWSIFVFLFLANGLQYFFGIEAKASLKNALSGTPEVGIELSEESKDLLTRTLPKIKKDKKPKTDDQINEVIQDDKDKKEVFYIKDNIYTYDEAKAVCRAYDAEIANYNQLEKTYEEGGEWCGYGWSKDQMILFPTQKTTWNELQKIDGHENDCGRPGVNGGFIENSNARFGVNCFGVKPSPTEFDLALLNEMSKKQYPMTETNKEFNKNVKKFKQQIKNNEIKLNPFNSDKWKW